MASALQCPACGHKHRLSELSGEPVFSCEQCGRLLKTPAEYRRPEPSAPTAGPASNGSARVKRAGPAARDPRAVTRSTGTPAAATAAPRRSGPRPPASMAVPLQVLAWVLAVIIGGVIVRYLAKITGLVTGDSVIDILTGTGWGRYIRVFALVPFWALATAGLMTGFVEGMRWWGERRRTMPSGRPARPAAAAAPVTAAKRPKPQAAPTPKAKRPAPTPAPSPARTRTQVPAPAPAPAPAEPDAAGDAPRPRRIPKRGDITF